MSYLALIDEQEVELGDDAAVGDAIARGEVREDTWIKDADLEADWEAAGERFPDLFRPADV